MYTSAEAPAAVHRKTTCNAHHRYPRQHIRQQQSTLLHTHIYTRAPCARPFLRLDLVFIDFSTDHASKGLLPRSASALRHRFADTVSSSPAYISTSSSSAALFAAAATPFPCPDARVGALFVTPSEPPFFIVRRFFGLNSACTPTAHDVSVPFAEAKEEKAGAYGVCLEELGRLLPAMPEEREHRGRRDVVCLARAHERVVLEQVLALGWRFTGARGQRSRVALGSRRAVCGRTFVDFLALFRVEDLLRGRSAVMPV